MKIIFRITLKNIDDVLRYLVNTTENNPILLERAIEDIIHDIAPRDRLAIIKKLENDKFVEIITIKEPPVNYMQAIGDNHYITFDGLFFIQNGGYEGRKIKNDRKEDNDWKYAWLMLAFIAFSALGTCVAAFYNIYLMTKPK